MIQRNHPESIFYDEDGNISVDLEKVSKENVKNSLFQIQRWDVDFH